MRSRPQPPLPRDAEPLPGAEFPRALPLAPGLWAIVADVPLAAFGQRVLDRRLKDLDWVSRCGSAHQAVVETFLRSSAVVPMMLFTIFASDDRVLEEMYRDRARLDASLSRVAGHTEWVARVRRGEPVAAARGGAAATTTPAAVVSGRAFLQAKADQRQAARRAAQEAEEAVRAFADALTACADAALDRTDVQGVASAALMDSAFLVAKSAEKRFEREARRTAQPLIARGLRVSVTGPWPCYSFAAREADS